MTKHFLKCLTIFLGMIVVGLIGVYLINYFDKNGEQVPDVNGTNQIAK